MSEAIFQIDPATKKPVAIRPVSFSELGVGERSDLQEWIINHPDMLGEPLLVITSEFASFDKSSKRLDILALDKSGTLAVVELKLNAGGSLADLQALRYAAFCSTMTAEQVISAYAEFHEVSVDDARHRISEFSESGGVPKLDGPPRIILAAGKIDDQELTGSVLWLRGFGLDISCVELTPYRMPGAGVVLVPRTIIPVPEAREYMVKVEQKQATEIQQERTRSRCGALWAGITDQFNAAGVASGGRTFKVEREFRGLYLMVGGYKPIHYEWVARWRSKKALDVAIHFESPDEATNEAAIAPLRGLTDALRQGVPEEVHIGRFGDGLGRTKWREVRYRIAADDPSSPSLAPRAVELMKLLIERTFPTLQKSSPASI